jgi:hypothetical protein
MTARRRHLMMFGVAVAGLALWAFGLLETVVLVACLVLGFGAGIALLSGASTVREAVGRLATWFEGRLPL